MTEPMLNRRAGLGKGLRLAFVAPAVLAAAVPGEAAASSGASKASKAGRAPVVQAPRPAPVAPPAQLQPMSWTGAGNVPVPQGTERMISDAVRLGGPRGDGAGPVRIDLEGARANASYEVAFVPSYDPRAVLPLGTIRTDERGVFHGAAPEQVPPLLEHQRAGTLVLRRLPML